MASIDRVDWHLGSGFPPDLPHENAGTHIGIFLTWVLSRGLGSPELTKMCGEYLEAFRSRRMTGRDLLMTCLDGKLFPALLNSDARSFARAYYESDQYFSDYDAAVGGDHPTLFHVADSWANAECVGALLDDRFSRWLAERGAAPGGGSA